jgi:hypothetical protein
LFGSVINLSQHGLMLLSSRPVESGGTVQLDLRRADTPEQPILEIAISVSWTRPADTPGNAWMGAHIIGISEAHANTLRNLIEEAESNR